MAIGAPRRPSVDADGSAAPAGEPHPFGDAGEAAVSALLAKSAAENFPVAPRFLPPVVRRDLMAIYGFARLVDDLGDEGEASADERCRALDAVEADVDRLFSGDTPLHPLLRPLGATLAAHTIGDEPFRRLIEANRVDQRVTRWATFDDLVGYCELSANPVGRLVLGVFDATTDERVAWSDSICTGLQLVEHWQDVAEDYIRGRIYVPLEDLDTYGVREPEFAAAPASDRVRRLMAFEVCRAGEWLDRGAPLVRDLSGLASLAVAAFLAGGRAALHAITAGDFDVVSATHTPTRPRVVREFARALAPRVLAARGSRP